MAVHCILIPVFGALLALENYRRLRDLAGMAKTVVLLLAPAVVLILLGWYARGAPRSVIVLVQASRVVLAAIAYIDQGKAVRPHFAGGGLKARWILAWLAMLPPFVVFLAIWQVLSPGR